MAAPRNKQPAREANIQALTAFFEAGIKPRGEERIGVEIEHILVDAQGVPLSYSGEHGVAWVLRQLQASYPRVTEHDGDILGVARSFAHITIEPGAQLELSCGPFCSIMQLNEVCERFDVDLAAVLEPIGARSLCVGYDPHYRALDKELIPKERYRRMNSYFLSKGQTTGPHMMRATASTQVSVDYNSEHDAVVKMRLASALAPVFALMMDNAPVYEGRPAPHGMMRTEVWRGLGSERCNTVPCVFDADFGFRRYAEYLLDVPAIVVPDDDGDDVHGDLRTFGEIYAERVMDKRAVEHVLGMVWPDARLKNYVEVRPADSVPAPYAISYVALIKGLFYGDARNVLDDELSHIRVADIEEAKTNVMARGYEAQVFGWPVAKIIEQMFQLARTGLCAEEAACLGPLAELTERRATLREMLRPIPAVRS